jgi:hypothetical protein
MSKFKKKPVTVDATLVTKEIVRAWAKGELEKPTEIVELDVWWKKEFPNDPNSVDIIDEATSTFSGKVRTLEGDMTFNIGDWLIRGVEQELYVCKDSVFKRRATEAFNKRVAWLDNAAKNGNFNEVVGGVD